MPDPTESPVYGSGLPQENRPQQPQQPQYGYQQPQQPQYNYQQPQQPQYNYQQPQQPQYNYQRPQQLQQPQQPQNNYQQPQYGYQQPQQQYGYQQPQTRQAYGYGQPQQAQQPQQARQPQYGAPQLWNPQTVTHKKAIGSMIMMFIALTLLAYPLGSALLGNFRALSYAGSAVWMTLLTNLILLAGLILMLIGAIQGSRGYKLFGIGLLLILAYLFYNHFVGILLQWNRYDEGINVLLLMFGTILITGNILAAIGCLVRVKALKIIGGILMLVNIPIVWFLEFGTMLDRLSRYNSSHLPVYFLRLIGFIFLCIAVLAFPIRKLKN